MGNGIMSFGSNSDIRGIFTQRRPPEENEECGDENLSDEYVLEKTGDEYEEQEYEDDPEEREEIDEIIPEEPVKKVRTKKESQESKDSSLKYSVTAKIGSIDKDFLTDVEDVFGLSTSQALIKCIECYRKANGDDVRSDAKKIRRIRNKQ